MTKKEAIDILGLDGDETKEEIKKKYRELIKSAHPDAMGGKNGRDNADSAQSINEAYALLKNGDLHGKAKTASKAPEKRKINAPVNPNAFSDRDVLSYVEDSEGRNIGEFPLGRGKYVWQLEEEFPLFLKSVYSLSNEILDRCEDDNPETVRYDERGIIQAELVFLLSQQYVDGSYVLNSLATKEGSDVFYISSMLEKAPGARVNEGENLMPAYVKNHRLYLNDIAGNVVGYISFKDDRFYYSVIPLFEQKRAMVKVKVSAIKVRFISLDLWIKIDTTKPCFPENLNLSIENCLKRYGGK